MTKPLEHSFIQELQLTQLCFAQFYLKTMTTTFEMLFVNAIELYYLVLHLLNAMVQQQKYYCLTVAAVKGLI